MAVSAGCSRERPVETPEGKLDAFLRELTELSRRHGIGVGDDGVLFVMESGPSGDFERRYCCGDDSKLRFD